MMTRSGSLLVVDDEEMNRDMLSRSGFDAQRICGHVRRERPRGALALIDRQARFRR